MPDALELQLGPDRKAELVGYLTREFNACVQARANQVGGKYTRWMDNYSGKPLEAIRTTPFYRASNFVPQLIRMHTDILSARVYGLILATRPMWNINTLMDAQHDDLDQMKGWMDSTSRYDLRLPEVLDTAIFRSFKAGQCMLKGPWVDKSVWKAESLDPTSKNIKATEVKTSFLDLRPVAFDDCWASPITIQWLRDARCIFHRIRLIKEQVQWRIDNAIWDATAGAKVLQGPEASQGTARESQATEAGVSLTPDVAHPYWAIEATFEYELEKGKTYELVVTFNPKVAGADGYLRGTYNPYKKLRNCYTELKFIPREDFLYGYSIPEILEQSQEEQAQIHNARRDSNTIGNIPTFKTKRYADQPNPSSEWYPGKVFVLDQMDDMDVLNLQVNYNSMIEEERFLMSLAEQYTGVQPPMQGYGSGVMQGKRGIYSSQGTLAMLSEGNKRLDIYLQRARYPFHDLGNLIYQSYKQFGAGASVLGQQGARGAAIKKSFAFNEPADFPGFFFNISASDAGANREVDRQSLLLMANTMAGYYRQIVEAGTAITQLPQGQDGKPHPLATLMLTVLDGAKDLANRLLFAFDVPDRKSLVPDVREILGGGPRAGAEQADRVGLPGSDETVSIDRLRSLSQGIDQSTSGALAAISGGNGRG